MQREIDHAHGIKWTDNMTSMRKSPFTLVELLVVVAILATLMSLLTPSIHSAYTSSQLIACAQKQSMIFGAQTMRSWDYDDHYALGGRWNDEPYDGFLKTYGTTLPNGKLVSTTSALLEYLGMEVDHSNWMSYVENNRNLEKMDPFVCPAETEAVKGKNTILGSLVRSVNT
jgi:prepilin-type N-terminal cleavage/methylation domain-containing protein